MNGFFPRRYDTDDVQRYGERASDGQHQQMMDMSGAGDMGSTSIPGAQSLDDIVSQNQTDLRRRSMPVPYGSSTTDIADSMRRASMADMMEFGGTSPQMDAFQFGDSVGQGFDSHMMDAPPDSTGQSRRRGDSNSNNNLAVNTQFPFPQHGTAYGQMNTSSSNFDSPMTGQNALDMDLNSPYLTSAFPLASNMSADMNMMSTGMPTNDMFGGQFGSPMVGSPVHRPYASSMLGPTMQDPGGGPSSRRDQGRSINSNPPSDVRQSTTRTNSNDTVQTTSQSGATSASTLGQGSGAGGGRLSNQSNPTDSINGSTVPWVGPQGAWQRTLAERQALNEQFVDAYAPSGYDVLSVLIKVATRPNPQINIGAVDLSCAFVVCNAKEHDNPIEYCSDSFERLTGYTKFEIKGQNCRFLQSPDGKVSPGTRRRYCDDDSVLYIKNCINSQMEAQISLINYRKGGQPFMNLLTMIPIINQMGETTHFVGFQVDLVENPTAINAKNPDGTYSINYQRHASMPGYQLTPPGDLGMTADAGQTVNRDEVSTVLGTIGSGESELSRRLMDKVLLENSDDVIHVLSLKGLFLYLSPSCRKVLEYDAGELVGTHLSSVCHPSDIVPVTRELKDPSSGSNLSVVFRIRRKHSGYMWFESHGSLHTEQGKGRKCIILVGRERPVYTLSKTALMAGGGIGDNELWTKMSTTGMFLFVSSNVRQLLDRQPEELVGINIQTQMRPESRDEFGRVLTLALTGKRASVRHEMTNRRGQVLQAFSWIYPGDATEGMKPTFLVTQIRLIRYHRGGAQRPSLPKGDSAGSLGSGNSNLTMGGHSTPFSNQSGGNLPSQDANLVPTTEKFPVSHAGQNGLAIGRQDVSLASDDNVFDELKTTRSTSWQYELRQMEKRNRMLAEEVQTLIAAKKKRKRRRGAGLLQKDCANCHTKNTPEWRRGPSGQRDLCNSCGLRWAKQNGRVSPRTSSQQSVKSGGAHSDKASKASASPLGDTSTIMGASPRGMPTDQQPNIAATMETGGTGGEKRSTATAQEASMERHAAKVARMEVRGTAGLSGGVPAKIEEEGLSSGVE